MNSKPNYNRIYVDLISKRFPEKKDFFLSFLGEREMSILDVIKINKELFGKINCSTKNNQKHRSYDKETVLKILNYQKKNKLNNSQLAIHFNLSRNTVSKWKKNFSI